MALRTIVTLPEAVLRRKARPVTSFDKDLQILIEDMIETMREYDGAGLAAPQVALPFQLLVMNITGDPKQPERELHHLGSGSIIRAIANERGQQLQEAGPSEPVEIMGLDGLSVLVRPAPKGA